MTITVSIRIENNDKYNSSTYTEATLDLTDCTQIAIACGLVADRIRDHLNCQNDNVGLCELAG